MKLFAPMYRKSMQWARHKHAEYYLGFVSFIESIFFPVPTDVMLAPMALAQPHRAGWLAGMSTVTSVVGGVVGYWLGAYLFDAYIYPIIEQVNYVANYEAAKDLFEKYGVYCMFIAALTPIPFKVFTVTAGALHMSFWPFVLGSLVGRAIRFYLVAYLMKWGGAKMEQTLHIYVERIGWATVAGLVCIVGVYKTITM